MREKSDFTGNLQDTSDFTGGQSRIFLKNKISQQNPDFHEKSDFFRINEILQGKQNVTRKLAISSKDHI